ncbi:ChaN family lipoprotein [Piscinibacter sakaiensis]|uniref:ChaN family lipoprotein n=1 Tax=Piscinibacter sakaiensis TaxID=1547922 RepID=UPI003AAAEC12
MPSLTVDPIRRRCVAALPCVLTPLLAAGCSLPATGPAAWERRLGGSTLALLGEVHDNADGQRLRLATLQRAIARGWRPAIVMEQFDTDRQPQIDASRRERPGDAGHLIEQAGGDGWDWPLYRPLVQLALDHQLPLIAGNLPRAQARRLVREQHAAVLGAENARSLGLDQPLPPDWQAAQQREIEIGHCNALPATMLPGMVRAQAARDAVLAERLARHRANGTVLIAGNGHVRRDIGVPLWLRGRHGLAAGDIVAIGYLESTDADAAAVFDAVVAIAPKRDRVDPCIQFRRDRAERPA